MKLFDFDTYSSCTRFLDPAAALTFVDVGAHNGVMVHRALFEFPRARVFAFEPSPAPRTQLTREFQNDRRVTILPFACASTSGTATFNITRNTQCSSLLSPSALGSHFYGESYDVVDRIEVRKITLDDWARENDITQIDFLKIDAQGHDLEVLRGAQALLKNRAVKAINVEAMFVPEYEGCATFGQIDAFLSTQGYSLHQIHEIVAKGPENQTTYCDALWVRKDILETLRTAPNLREIGLGSKLNSLVSKFKNSPAPTYALYGAGEHTRRLLKLVNDPATRPVAIADDRANLWGSFVEGVPVVNPATLPTMGIRNIILSSDAYEPQLWDQSKTLRTQGINVEPLYRQYAA
jgi:FkbM family methyltransferase